MFSWRHWSLRPTNNGNDCNYWSYLAYSISSSGGGDSESCLAIRLKSMQSFHPVASSNSLSLIDFNGLFFPTLSIFEPTSFKAGLVGSGFILGTVTVRWPDAWLLLASPLQPKNRYNCMVTTLQSTMNAKLSKHGFWHCHENGLI